MDFSAKSNIFWISCVSTNFCQTVQHTGARGTFHDPFHTYSVSVRPKKKDFSQHKKDPLLVKAKSALHRLQQLHCENNI